MHKDKYARCEGCGRDEYLDHRALCPVCRLSPGQLRRIAEKVVLLSDLYPAEFETMETKVLIR